MQSYTNKPISNYAYIVCFFLNVSLGVFHIKTQNGRLLSLFSMTTGQAICGFLLVISMIQTIYRRHDATQKFPTIRLRTQDIADGQVLRSHRIVKWRLAMVCMAITVYPSAPVGARALRLVAPSKARQTPDARSIWWPAMRSVDTVGSDVAEDHHHLERHQTSQLLMLP